VVGRFPVLFLCLHLDNAFGTVLGLLLRLHLWYIEMLSGSFSFVCCMHFRVGTLTIWTFFVFFYMGCLSQAPLPNHLGARNQMASSQLASGEVPS